MTSAKPPAQPAQPAPTAQASPPQAGGPPRVKYKRSFRNYLIDSRFQLKYTSFILIAAVTISAVLGIFLWRTSGEVVAESQKVVEQSKKVSDVVKMSIKDDPVYGDNPALAAEFTKASQEQDSQIQAQQDALIRQQRQMLYSLVGALAVMVFFIGVLGIYFTHKVAGPIYKMKLLLNQVAEVGLLDGALADAKGKGLDEAALASFTKVRDDLKKPLDK